MIDISFLKPPLPDDFSISGREFLEWQNNNNFYTELVEVLDENYKPSANEFELDNDVCKKISNIIKKHTNLEVTFKAEKGLANACIDAAFVNKGNVLNHDFIEKWYNAKHTNLADAYKYLKQDVIRGWCDVRTGKVEGDFTKLKFQIIVDPWLPTWMDEEKVEKLGYSYPEAIAAFILHECGHAWSALYFLSQTFIDNVLIRKAASMYTDGNASESTKAAIIKDCGKILQIKPEDIKKDLTEEEVIVYFSKGLANRNMRRSLSMGVKEMSSEVLADAYAIRMGASKALVSGLVSFPRLGLYSVIIITVLYTLIPAFYYGASPITFLVGGIAFLFSSVMVLNDELVHGIYDTPYRRMRNVLRECITRIKSTSLTNKEKMSLIEDARAIEKVVEENKPYFESTAVQRLLGWLSNGSDFRKTDFEHYTQELSSTTLTLYSNGYFQEG